MNLVWQRGGHHAAIISNYGSKFKLIRSVINNLNKCLAHFGPIVAATELGHSHRGAKREIKTWFHDDGRRQSKPAPMDFNASLEKRFVSLCSVWMNPSLNKQATQLIWAYSDLF